MIQAVLTALNFMPLCFRISRSDKIAGTLDYIPGNVLLGGLAATHNRLSRKKDEFTEFFIKGKIRFCNLYPANFKTLRSNDRPVRPLPATARSCKRFAGFRFKDDPSEDELDIHDERHGVADHLIPWVLFSINQQHTEILDKFNKCQCGEYIMDRFEGFYRRGDDRNQIALSKISKRMLTRTGISRRRGAVMEEILYNREVLEENQKFWGLISFENRYLMEIFDEFLEEASDEELIYLGNSKTRGLGKIHLEIEQDDDLRTDNVPENILKNIKQRLDKFNKKLKMEAENYNSELPDSIYIPVTLESDVIINNDLLHCMTHIDSDYMEKLTGLKRMKLIYKALATRRVMGWNSAYGIPKPDDIAIKMGSVFLFAYNGDRNESFWESLLALETEGLGKRKEEGFGKIIIADDFHREVDQI